MRPPTLNGCFINELPDASHQRQGYLKRLNPVERGLGQDWGSPGSASGFCRDWLWPHPQVFI